MQRRAFIKTAMAGAAAVMGGFARAEAPAAELKLGSQESKIPGKTLRDKVLQLQDWGGVGLELHGNPAGRIQEVKDALQGTRVRVSALCWGSDKGQLVSTDAAVRAQGIENLKEALKTAGELASTGVIFVPCFHKQSALSPEELDKVMLDILPELGAFAQACGTRVLLEPLNRGETFYLKQLAHAARICKAVNHPGIAIMGDFYHMGIEESSDEDAFVAAGPYLHHVHLASRKRWMPGQDDRSYVAGFRGLKRIGYRDYCSLECGLAKDTKVEEALPAGFRLLEQQWKEAVV